MAEATNGRLAGKTTLITGAASGFGRAMAIRFAREGAKVGVLDVNGEGARTVAREIGGAAIPIACDVTAREQVESAIEQAWEAFGRLDVLVNNAGWSHKNQPLMEVDEVTFDKVYAVNVKSIFHFTQACVPRWRDAQSPAVMINVTSTAGIRPRPGLTWYNGSKGAANLLTKSLAVELAPDKIRVNGLAPVIGNTALLETFMGLPDTPENRAKFVATVPWGRLSEPEDVANAALFLASDEAEFLTGVIVEVDGGRTV